MDSWIAACQRPAFVLLMSVALSACHQGASETASAQPGPQPAASGPRALGGGLIEVPAGSPLQARLQMQSVAMAELRNVFSAPATIEALPEKLVKVAPPVAGRIVRLYRSEGDAVKAGDPLFDMDSSEISSLRADHSKAEAEVLQARRDFDRQKLLYEADIAARKDYEAAQLALQAAQADARASGDRLTQLGAAAHASSRSGYVMRSPINGRVVEMAGAQGKYWNDINEAVMTVADLSAVWLSANVTERDLSSVAVGQQAHIALTAYPDLKLEGRVRYVGELLDPETRSVKVRVAVDNREGRLRPGMFARVSFDGPARQALVVPASAVLQSSVSTRVFVEKAPSRYASRDVQLGQQQGDQVEVTAGLAAGERVVVNGGVLLQ